MMNKNVLMMNKDL